MTVIIFNLMNIFTYYDTGHMLTNQTKWKLFHFFPVKLLDTTV